MTKLRLDAYLAYKKLVPTRSQAESAIKLGAVTVNGKIVTKPGTFVSDDAVIRLNENERYVSRAGLKLASVAQILKLDFRGKTVLDIGSSTGGFTDYSLQHGATKVYAVDVGTEQLHPSLRRNKQIELHEKTDIRNVFVASQESRVKSQEKGQVYIPYTDIIVIDVSFISLREILPHVSSLMTHDSVLVAMLKPQFEAGAHQTNKGIIKNDAVRRQILKDFETWAKQYFVVQDKRDSDVAGAKGNQERFYLLRPLQK